jgi:hypothetical protein
MLNKQEIKQEIKQETKQKTKQAFNICIACNKYVARNNNDNNNDNNNNNDNSNVNFYCSKACLDKFKIMNLGSIYNEIDFKYGPKIIKGADSTLYPEYLIKLLPDIWFRWSIRCDKCYLRFIAICDDNTVPKYCPSCYDNTIMTMKCMICKCDVNETPLEFKRMKWLCDKCN